MFDSIWIVRTHFCKLPLLTQQLVKKAVSIIVDGPNYTMDTSLYRVTDYVHII